jgi:hypothetical protein
MFHLLQSPAVASHTQFITSKPGSSCDASKAQQQQMTQPSTKPTCCYWLTAVSRYTGVKFVQLS